MQGKEREYVSIDWVMKILVGLVAFFLLSTYLTVQQTAKDVSDLKSTVAQIQGQYSNLSNRIHNIESQSKQ